MDWIKALKAGDEVFVTTDINIAGSPANVARTTNTQVVLESGQHFYKNNGRSVEGGKWSRTRLVQSTAEAHEKHALANLRSRARTQLNAFPIPNTREDLERMIAFLNTF